MNGTYSNMPTRSAASIPTETLVRVGMIMGVPDVLRSLGLDPASVLAQCGLGLDLFNDAENKISLCARNQLLAHCAATAKCEYFGLQVGGLGGLQSFGLIGLLARYSPDVHTALNNLLRYFQQHASHGAISFKTHGDSAALSYQSYGCSSTEHRQIGHGALAILFNTLRELCGPAWTPEAILFNHAELHDSKPLRKFFGHRARFHFNAEMNTLIFSSSWLETPLPRIHNEVYGILDRQIHSLVSQHRGHLPDQIRNVLHAALLDGDARADRVAALFGVHPRTLNRHLSQFSISYQGMLDGLRFELAQQMLQDSDVCIGDLALLLNYADARAFIRAFRRWSGVTPAQWRAARKSRPTAQVA
jgi:AraC-like DNA-binding protein